MSDRILTEEEKAAAARRGPAGARQGGPPHMALGAPGEKPKSFLASAKRLLGLLRPERALVILAITMGFIAVVLQAAGPRILGWATDRIFEGLIGRRMPAGVTQEQVVAQLRAAGQDKMADMVAAMTNLVPGQGVDFAAVGRILTIAVVLFVVAALFQWLQARILVGVVNRAIFNLRRDVEDKLHRLPLPYFDKQPRGEVLSRVTNDIDNMAQSLQQTLAQLLTALLTVLAMLGMMFWISPLLALIALVTVPVTMVVAGAIGKRAQGHFKEQ